MSGLLDEILGEEEEVQPKRRSLLDEFIEEPVQRRPALPRPPAAPVAAAPPQVMGPEPPPPLPVLQQAQRATEAFEAGRDPQQRAMAEMVRARRAGAEQMEVKHEAEHAERARAEAAKPGPFARPWQAVTYPLGVMAAGIRATEAGISEELGRGVEEAAKGIARAARPDVPVPERLPAAREVGQAAGEVVSGATYFTPAGPFRIALDAAEAFGIVPTVEPELRKAREAQTGLEKGLDMGSKAVMAVSGVVGRAVKAGKITKKVGTWLSRGMTALIGTREGLVAQEEFKERVAAGEDALPAYLKAVGAGAGRVGKMAISQELAKAAGLIAPKRPRKELALGPRKPEPARPPTPPPAGPTPMPEGHRRALLEKMPAPKLIKARRAGEIAEAVEKAVGKGFEESPFAYEAATEAYRKVPLRRMLAKPPKRAPTIKEHREALRQKMPVPKPAPKKPPVKAKPTVAEHREALRQKLPVPKPTPKPPAAAAPKPVVAKPTEISWKPATLQRKGKKPSVVKEHFDLFDKAGTKLGWAREDRARGGWFVGRKGEIGRFAPTKAEANAILAKGLAAKPVLKPATVVPKPPTAKEEADQIVGAARKKAAKEIVGEKWEAAKKKAVAKPTFAADVQKAAQAATRKFGDRVDFKQAYDQFVKQTGSKLTFDQFRTQLDAARQKGEIALTRADMPVQVAEKLGTTPEELGKMSVTGGMNLIKTAQEPTPFERMRGTHPPGLSGGVTGQPPLKVPKTLKTQKTMLTGIKAAYKQSGVTESVYREVIRDITQGRTNSSKNLTQPEAKKLRSALQARVMAKDAPREIADQVTRRPPPQEEIKRQEQVIASAVKEVETRHKPRFKGKMEKEQGPVRRILFSDQTNPITFAEEMFGKKSAGQKVMDTDLRAGRDREASMLTGAERYVAKAHKSAGLTDAKMRRYSNAVPGGKAKQFTVNLTGNRTMKLTPDTMAHIIFGNRDPGNARVAATRGITIEGGDMKAAKLSAADLKLLEGALKKVAPEMHRVISPYTQWNNAIGYDMVAKTRYLEDGTKLPQHPQYAPGRRDPRHMRGIQAERLGPAQQLENHMHDYMASQARFERAEAIKGAKAARTQAKLLPTPAERKARRAEISKEFKGKVAAGKRLVKGLQRVELGRSIETGAAPREFGQKPFLKERVGGQAPMVYGSLINTMRSHMQSVIHYSARAIPIRNAQLLISNPKIMSAIKARFANGEQLVKRMQDYLRAYGSLDVQKTDALDQFVGGMLRRAATAAVGLKAHIVAYQPVSYVTAWAGSDLPLKHWMKGVAGWAAPALKEINEHAPFLARRTQAGGLRVMSPVLTPTAKMANRDFFGMKAPTLGEIGTTPIRWTDTFTITRIWNACKSWAKADGLTGDALMKETAKRATDIVDRTQPGWDPTVISKLQLEARRSPFKKMMVVFGSQRNQNINVAVRAVNEYRHEKTPANFAKMIKGTVVPIIGTSAMVYGIRHGARKAVGYQEEKDFWGHMEGVIDQSMGNWLVGSDVVGVAKRAVKAGVQKRPRILWPKGDEALVSRAVTDTGEAVTALIQAILASAEKKYRLRKHAPEKWMQFASEALQSFSALTGVPLSGVEQYLRPTLRPKKKLRRR